jgi:hypothetical protein
MRRQISEEEIQRATKIHEEMFGILTHKGNANQNYTKFPSHPRKIGNYQENKQQQMLDSRKKEPSSTVGGDAN